MPLSCIQEVIVNRDGVNDKRVKCMIEPSGMYLRFTENGERHHISGHELTEKLKNIENHLNRSAYQHDRQMEKDPKTIDSKKSIAKWNDKGKKGTIRK